MTVHATPTPGSKLLTPKDHTLIMIDFQSQMAFATKSIDAINLRNNAALVANAAKGFGVSTILTTVVAAMAGYSLSRFKVRGGQSLGLFILTAKMLPATLLVIPLFGIVSALPVSIGGLGLREMVAQGISGPMHLDNTHLVTLSLAGHLMVVLVNMLGVLPFLLRKAR